MAGDEFCFTAKEVKDLCDVTPMSWPVELSLMIFRRSEPLASDSLVQFLCQLH